MKRFFFFVLSFEFTTIFVLSRFEQCFFQKIMLLIIFSSYTDQGTWKHNLLFAPCKGIRKVLLVGWGILDFGIWNAAQGIRNPTNDWKPECKFQYLKSTAWKYWLTSPHMKRYYVLLQLTKQYISTIGKALLRKSDFLYIFHSNYILLCFGSAIYYSWIQNKVRTKHFLESISCHYRVFSMSRNENKK